MDVDEYEDDWELNALPDSKFIHKPTKQPDYFYISEYDLPRTVDKIYITDDLNQTSITVMPPPGEPNGLQAYLLKVNRKQKLQFYFRLTDKDCRKLYHAYQILPLSVAKTDFMHDADHKELQIDEVRHELFKYHAYQPGRMDLITLTSGEYMIVVVQDLRSATLLQIITPSL